MDLLNIVAQIIVVCAALIWVLLKSAWNMVVFIWELLRDYTPIFAKKIGKFFHWVTSYLKKGAVLVQNRGLPSFYSAFIEAKNSFQARLPGQKLTTYQSQPTTAPLEPGIQVSPLGMVLPQDEAPKATEPRVQAQTASPTMALTMSMSEPLGKSSINQQPAFFNPLPEVKGGTLSAIFSGLFSFSVFMGEAVLKLVSFLLYASQFALSFVVYIGAVVLSVVLSIFSKLVGLRQHAPSTQDTFSFLSSLTSRQARLVPRFSTPDVSSRFKREPGVSEPAFVLETPSSSKQTVPSKLLSRLSFLGMITTAILLFGLVFPDIALKVLPYKTEPIQSAVNASALGGDFDDGNLYSAVKLPERNEYLPDGNWISIPKIGVMTQIHEQTMEDHEEALKKGVWRVPDFADPTQGKEYPTILVAHKYGYLKWSNQFRRQNSFYNLEKLKIGDTFEVIWDKRKFVYEIYAGDEGKEITDYDADMILYTCKHLNSPVRIFRYARRVEY